MKFSNIIAPLSDWWAAVKLAILPTLWEAVECPPLLLAPRQLSQIFFSYVWKGFAPFVDEGGREVKQSLIRPNAYGVVLDVGAGHGHAVHYLDRSRVTKYVALEPNGRMHEEIRKQAALAGFDEEKGEVLILGCGAEEVGGIIAKLGGEHQVDTIVSILTFCTVPHPQETIKNLVDRVLKPRGSLLYYEHVQSDLPDVSWWQSIWTPIWALAFDGCCLDRPTHKWINNAALWDTESKVWGKPGEEKENIFWHQAGHLIRE